MHKVVHHDDVRNMSRPILNQRVVHHDDVRNVSRPILNQRLRLLYCVKLSLKYELYPTLNQRLGSITSSNCVKFLESMREIWIRFGSNKWI